MPMFNFGQQQAQVPQQAQPQGGGFLQQLLAPETAMPIAAALLGNQGNSQNFGNAFGAYGQAAAQTAGKNKTLDFFRKNAPEYADMVDAGMPLNEAWQTYTQQRYAQKGQGLINAGDGNIYDPKTSSWITAPNSQNNALFDGKSVQAQGLNYLVQTGELTKEQAAQLAAGKTITDPSSGAITFMTPQGLVTQPGGNGGQGGSGNGAIPLTGPKKPTDTEYVTKIYADRMANSGKIIDKLEETGTSFQDNAVSGLPLGNYMISGDYQKFDQAQRDFINAVLRRESGAVISDEEFDNARRQYLPQPGDTEQTLAQKRRNRQIAIDGMRRASGPGMPQQGAPQGGQGGNRTQSGVSWSVE